MATAFDVKALILPDERPVTLAGSSASKRAPVIQAMLDLPPRDVGPDGIAFPVDWGTPDGAEAVEVDPVTVTLAADAGAGFAGFPLGELAASVQGGAVVVTVPPGQRIRALHLAGLATDEEHPVPLNHEGDLGGRRLSVSVPDPSGGWATPVVSAPAVGARGQIPATLTGAGFADSVLRLPDVAGARLRVTLVEGDTPDEFATVAVTVGTVTGWASTIAKDLELAGIDGTTLWAFPGELLPGGARVTADVTVGVSAALEAMRAAGQPMTGSLTLRGKHLSRVGISVPNVTGSLVRRIPGTTSTVLRGEPGTFAAPGAPLVGVPTTVIADLHVTYAGMRLADISDALPAPGAQSGTVVRDGPVFRTYPPQALNGERVTRIGLVGCCPEPTALLVRLVPVAAATGAVGRAPGAVGQPGVVSVEPADRPGVVWVDLPEPVTVDRAVAIEVSASRGRFLWVGEHDPLVRVVVLDPDPGNRPVVLGAGTTAPSTLFSLRETELSVLRAALPSTPFAGGSLVLASALFCTVEITDVELRYRRGSGA